MKTKSMPINAHPLANTSVSEMSTDAAGYILQTQEVLSIISIYSFFFFFFNAKSLKYIHLKLNYYSYYLKVYPETSVHLHTVTKSLKSPPVVDL